MKLNVAESMVLFLKKKGVNTSFGVIGGAIEPITDAVSRFGLDQYYPSHETTCAYAASKYYEYSNAPALVFVTAGPGILNLINGLGSSFDERKPLFLIVPQEKLSSHEKGPMQSSRRGGVNTVNILREVTCYCDEINSPLHLEQKLNFAWLKMFECQQPVALSVPSDVFTQYVDEVIAIQDVEIGITQEIISGMGCGDCIVVGDGCSGILFNIIAYSKRKNIPLIDVPASRGLVPNGVSSYRGMVGMAGNDSAFKIVESAKRIFFFYGVITETNIGGNQLWLDKTVFITDRIVDTYRARSDKYLVQKYVINTILSDLLGESYQCFTDGNRVLSREYNLSAKICTPDLYDFLSERLPVDTSVFFDAGNSFLFGLNRWNVRKTKYNRDKLINVSMNQASMASAIPSLLGAVVACPDKTYLCVTGDGSFKMGSNELSTLGGFNSNIVLVVLNDSVMGMAMHGQRIAGADVVGIDNGFTDFALIANASGVRSFIVKTMNDMMKVPLDLKETILIDVRIDREVVPPILQRMKSLNNK